MSKEDYIVVRRRNATVVRGARGRTTIEVDQLTPSKIETLRDDELTIGVAPVVPLKLHKPVSRKEVDARAANVDCWGLAAVGADISTVTGNGVTVAVLDTGIEKTHPAFLGVDIVQKDFTGDGDGDLNGHGTHCAGTIFGRPVNGMRIGVAPGITQALIGKVLGSGPSTSAMLAMAIQWAVDSGAQIVSMSLGIDYPGMVNRYEQDMGFPPAFATAKAILGYQATTELFSALVRYQTKLAKESRKAIVFVAAAGNESKRDERADFVLPVSPPAAAEGIISVGALERGENAFRMAPYSNGGMRVVAPGTDIVSAGRASAGRANVLETMSGTSMATPHVAGVLALWAERLGTKRVTSDQLKAKIEGQATRDGLDSTVDETCLGLVRAP